ncbi:MAG: uroporphyrinogen-III synthase [Gemmatimonadetes bacterium]|nr:uroporphyrinogen-III synthase [Gemmatimonadota bacterium]
MIYFVGGGPGDPGLLTVRGAELLARAGVVVVDAGAGGPAPGAARVEERAAGEAPAAVAARLRRLVETHDVVVRLVPGDALTAHGAATAEARELRRAGVPFEVVRGVPSAEAMPLDRRPLFGRRVVVTRAREQSAEFVAWLEAQGAEAVLFPAIRIVPPPDPGPLLRAAERVREYDWIVLTSVNGVERFWEALDAVGLDTRALGGARVAAIGPATAAALRARGVRANLVPSEYVAESLIDAMAAGGSVAGARILLPRAAGAREILPERLRELGGEVDEVEAYRAVRDAAGAEEIRRRLDAGELDALTFTSPSTVRGFVEAVGPAAGAAVVACIGPVTAASARELGLPVAVVAAEHTMAGLGAALLAFYEGNV